MLLPEVQPTFPFAEGLQASEEVGFLPTKADAPIKPLVFKVPPGSSLPALKGSHALQGTWHDTLGPLDATVDTFCRDFYRLG